MPAGVYKIQNKISGKFLIGSTNNFQIRKRNHFSDARCNKHPRLGKIHTLEVRKRISLAGVGRKKSEITLRKHSESMIKAWMRRKANV